MIERVIGAIYEVAKHLGSGFLEKVYERALVLELRSREIGTEAQVAVRVLYKGETVGDCYVDLLVEDKLIVELKCVDSLTNEHMAQTLNYLRASSHHIALLVNFQQPKVEWRRVVYNF